VSGIRAAGAADVAAMVDLLSARSRALHGVADVDPEAVRRRLGQPECDAWLLDGVGCAWLDAAGEIELCATEGAVAGALLGRARERARERALPAVTLMLASEDEPLAELVRRAGLRLERTILRMWRELAADEPDGAPPDGVAVRAYEDADAAAVKALLDVAYGGWDSSYARQPLADWLAFMTDHDEFDPELWFLAECDGELVGCALHWRESRRHGWVKDVAVAERERGRGLATALLRHGFHVYAQRGAERVGLKVDAANPTGAPQLYERLGFRTDRRYALWAGRP
jgi:ribosomal protein S18 acetylase RimI-like enzyme